MGRFRGVHVALTVVVGMWGLVFVGIARLLPQLDTSQLVVIRFTLIALVFLGIFAVVPSTRPHISGPREFGLFALMGVLAVPGAQLSIVKYSRQVPGSWSSNGTKGSPPQLNTGSVGAYGSALEIKKISGSSAAVR